MLSLPCDLYQRQFRHFTAIHKPPPLQNKMFAGYTLQNLGGAKDFDFISVFFKTNISW